MRIHKEGQAILIGALIFSMVLYLVIAQITTYDEICEYITGIILILLLCFLTFFFRNPKRRIVANNAHVVTPADGRIVAIEEVYENEYLNSKCICISIFMSVWNVHVNRYPVSGNICYTKYHPGKYLIASYPKASELNEHHSTIIETTNGIRVMVKQIAGAVARRVVCYAKIDKQIIQGEDLGFIKFGSRVDLFLPLNAEVKVKLNEKVKGNRTIIARFNP